jgi:hypothetical protein
MEAIAECLLGRPDGYVYQKAALSAGGFFAAALVDSSLFVGENADGGAKACCP